MDRSAAYICRQMAKSIVKSGLCKRALVQLSYAIGVAKPLSLFVETYGTEQAAKFAILGAFFKNCDIRLKLETLRFLIWQHFHNSRNEDPWELMVLGPY